MQRKQYKKKLKERSGHVRARVWKGERNIGFFFLLLLLSLTFCSCGRKIKNIFSFDEQELPRVNKLALPAVQGVAAKKTPQGNLISWFAVEVPENPNPATPYLCIKNFAGYNVYRLVRTNIIPKHPRNKLPLKNTTFLDSKQHAGYYLVRAAFTYNNAVSEGPISHIVYTRD